MLCDNWIHETGEYVCFDDRTHSLILLYTLYHLAGKFETAINSIFVSALTPH